MWFVSTSSRQMEGFFQIRFRIIGRKPNNIQTNREAWILIKVHYLIHQWIRLDKLCKLMEFFSNFGIIFWIKYTFKIIVALGLCKRGWGGGRHLCWLARVLVLNISPRNLFWITSLYSKQIVKILTACYFGLTKITPFVCSIIRKNFPI